MSSTYFDHCVGPLTKEVPTNNSTNAFTSTFNGAINLFKNAHVQVKYKLFKNFCMPLYGCTLWDYNSAAMSRL